MLTMEHSTSNYYFFLSTLFLPFSIISLFLQLRVDGYSYVGAGVSTSKKDAQANAARDFIQFLVRQGEMNDTEAPDLNQVCYSILLASLHVQ